MAYRESGVFIVQISAEYFDIFCEEEVFEFAQYLEQILDAALENVISDFSLPPPPERYQVFVCQDRAEYICRTGKRAEEYQDWMVGWADKQTVCLLDPEVSGLTWNEIMGQIAVHEVVHIALGVWMDPDEANICLAEGTAVAYAGQIDAACIQREEFPSIRDIWTEDGFYEYNGYQYSGVYAKALLDHFGLERFKRFYTGAEKPFALLDPEFEKNAIERFLES